jgi:hypothetical protein
VQAGLAAASGRPAEQIEFRVAASVAQFGIAARLICPVFGSAVLDAEIPIDVAYARWVPALGGPFRLSLPDTGFEGTAFESAPGQSQTPAGDDVREPLHSLLGGPIGSLVEMTAAMATSRRVLWGNVASAINGAAAMISATQPELTAAATATASAMLGFPALAGVYQGQPVTTFRRRNCCLIYRLATSPAEYCGDCILPGLPRQTRAPPRAQSNSGEPPRARPHSGTASHDRSHLGEFRSQLSLQAFEKPSGRPDLNRRPLDPQPCFPIPTTRSPSRCRRSRPRTGERDRAVESGREPWWFPASSQPSQQLLAVGAIPLGCC